MPTTPKHNPMSRSELAEYGAEKRQSKLYRAETAAFSDQQISELVQRTARELDAARAKINLSDTETVREVTQEYLSACVDTSTVPSISGLCRALGCSRTAFYHIVNTRTPRETADFFETVHDAFSDVLAEASLRGAVQPVVAIFLQKALFGHSEKVEIVATAKPSSPLGEQADQAALEAKLADVVIDED